MGLDSSNVNQLQTVSNDRLRPDQSLEPMLGNVIDLIIDNKGDLNRVDLSGLINALAKETGIPEDSNRKVLLKEFFIFNAFPPSGVLRPQPPLNIEGLKNLKLEDVIKFWKKPKLELPV